MSVQLTSPQGLLHPVPYNHVAVGTGSRHVFLAGQTARPADGGNLDGVDLRAQVSAALRSVGTAVAGVGGSFADVARLTCYVPNWNPDMIDNLMHGFTDVAAEIGMPDPWPPMTLIGVHALWEPDILVEIEAVAVLD